MAQLRFVAVASGTLALTFALLLLLAASTPGSVSDFANRIQSTEQRTGARIGVPAIETGGGKRLNYRSEERFPMCSTFKFLAAAAVLKRVDEGQEKLDRFVSYGALCAAAIEQSDNTAANLLLNAIGGPVGLTTFAHSVDDEITRLDRKEPELNNAIPGDERDTTSPAAMCADMQRLLLGNMLSESSRHQLENWLRHNETGTLRIRAAIPKAWTVGDETGWCANGATNDVAFVRPPRRAPIVSSEVRHPVALALRGAAGFLDFASNDNREMPSKLASCAKFHRWKR